ncbi:MAG: flagellar basal body L-ring protein FlgH [Plesiomonas sp.]
MITNRFAIWWLVVINLFLQGCNSTPQQYPLPQPGDQSFAPPVLQEQAVQYASQGTMYNKSYVMTLFQDRRAYRVGDMLTVSLDEQTSSTKQANTRYGKSSGANVSGGLSGSPWSARDADIGLDADRDFNGSAQSTQKNTLRGAITVVVASVLPNGILQVRGEKWLKLNQGDEYIRLSGLVRVEDIDGLNRISSQRLGDARITYSGRGDLANANEAGWLTRLFVNPWFPL